LVVRDYARRFRTPVLVETGTYLGDMVEAQRRHFERIYSIELGQELAHQAQRRFAAWPHITIIVGDSGDQLAQLLPEIPEACLFWLDGHYSEGTTARGTLVTPVRRELASIMGSRRRHDVVLIDDARLFTGHDDYPMLDELLAWVRRERPEWITAVLDDIIRLCPVGVVS
jgi:hypothetical protein